MVRNVIFDWSGTLVDDLPAVWEASNRVFRRASVPEFSLERFRAEFQLPFERFYAKYTSHVPMDQLEHWFHQHFAEVQDKVVPLPHAREFLDYCRTHGYRMFLLSAVHPRHFSTQTRDNRFDLYLEHAYLGVRDKREKVRGLLSDHGLLAEETIFIGDMEHDVETARHGGIRSVAVLTGYNSLQQLRDSEPDLIVEHLGELQAVLQRNASRLPVVARDRRAPALDRRPISTVGGLIFNDAGQVLMVRTRKWSDLWGIPGGKIEYGETSEAALRRELMEETGLAISDIQFVLVQDAIQPPEFYREAHFLLLNYTCRAVGVQEVRLNAEAQAYRWVTLSEARNLPLNGPTRILLDAIDSRIPSGSQGHPGVR